MHIFITSKLIISNFKVYLAFGLSHFWTTLWKNAPFNKKCPPYFFSLTRPNKPLVYYTKHAHFHHFYDFLYKFYLSLGCFRYLLILLLNILYFFCRRSSVGTFIRQPTESGSKKKDPPPKLDYRSMVSVEDKPELFASFDSKSLQFWIEHN